MVMPGESVAFTVRAFDNKGRLIGETKGDWSLAGQRLPEGLPPPPASAARHATAARTAGPQGQAERNQRFGDEADHRLRFRRFRRAALSSGLAN